MTIYCCVYYKSFWFVWCLCKCIRILSSDVLKFSTCWWKKYFSFHFYLEKMTVLLADGNLERQVGQCDDVWSPHCWSMISQKTHAWVPWNQIGHILCVLAARAPIKQIYHFDNDNHTSDLFLGFKSKNEAEYFCTYYYCTK